jgi:hypothetical protein
VEEMEFELLMLDNLMELDSKFESKPREFSVGHG